MTTNDDLRELIVSLSKNQESFAEHSKTQFKGVRAHHEDIESWKKEISSEVASRAKKTQKENFDAVNLRSGRVLAENQQGREEAAAKEHICRITGGVRHG